jgi:uncharacterized repeat protein (TIGR01451 family)
MNTKKSVAKYYFSLFMFLNCVYTFSQKNITHVYTTYDGWWSSGIGAINSKFIDDSSILLAFEVNGIIYSTGINNALLDTKLGSGNYNNITEYEALPVEKINTVAGSYIGIPYRWGGIEQLGGGLKTGYYTLPQSATTYYLTDGTHGLEMSTAVFNIASGFNSEYPIQTINPAEIGSATTAPDIIVTQMGEPGSTDTFKFIDNSGNTVGNSVSVVLGGIDPIGKILWAFFNPSTLLYSSPQPGNSTPSANTRDIRMRVFDLEDFGLNASNYLLAKKFVHILGGQSDPAFMGSYNKNAFSFVLADLKVEKTVNTTNTVSEGENVQFSITVTNNGPSDATNVVVKDLLPNGYTFISASPLVGSYNASTGDWIIGDLANGDYEILTINARVKSGGDFKNIAVVSADQSDPNVLNNTASALVNLGGHSIALVKEGTYVDVDANGLINAGDRIDYTFTVTNTGSVTINNLRIDDAKLGVNGLAVSPASIAPTMVGTVTKSYILKQADIDAYQVVNTATATGKDPDNNNITDISGSNNNNDDPTVVPLPPKADLSVVKSIDKINPDINSTVIFTITVTNNGPAKATNVRVSDIIPAGYTYISSEPSVGTNISGDTLTWIVETLNNGASAVLKIKVIVNN